MARRALLVGVNDYKDAGDLRGCVNDVLDMHFTLRCLLNFETKDIRVLTDSRATKENIMYRLKWLVKGAQAGDFLVFHFSGHGSQVRDRNGDELSDGLDELICPYDMNWDGTYITDDNLNKVFKSVPKGALLEVYIDSCHSGTVLREMGLTPPLELQAEHPVLHRFLPPPADIYLRAGGEEDHLKKRGFLQGAASRTSKKHHILWAGCQANQTSADAFIDGRYHGAFTYFFCKHLRKSPRISRSKLLGKVRSSLVHGGYSQIPQLELDATQRGRAVFSDNKIDE